MELLLIRHALPVRVEDADGPADPDLSEAGQHQARFLADYLADERLHAVFASPMRRAHQTALRVAERQGVEVQLEEGVAEWDRHHTEYIPVEQMKAEGHPGWKQMVDGTYQATLGVDLIQFRTEVVAAIEAIIKAHPGKKVAIVCHGGVIAAYLTQVLGLPDPNGFFYPNYTSIHRVAAASTGERSIVTINETFHLRGTGLPIGLFGE